MEFKGTKGKWEGMEHVGIFLENGDPVFETGCGCCTGSTLDKYDALLISKAPEMLEMLKEIFYGDSDPNELFKRGEQLIKEATELKSE